MTVPQIDPYPAAPGPSDPGEVFDEKAFEFTQSLDPRRQQMNQVAQFVNDTVTQFAQEVDQAVDDATQTAVSARDTAVASANTATQAASDAESDRTAAQEARDAALAVVGFAGKWADLTGALNIPATVFHQGAYWRLLNDLADVTASEPANDNADWLFVYSNAELRRKLLDEATLYADFANGDYRLYEGIGLGLVRGKQFGELFSFIRGSSANGFGINKLESVPVDTPRFVCLASNNQRQGILNEELRTNILSWSEDFTQTSWAKVSGLTASSNAFVSPDGTMSSDVLTTDGVSAGQVHQDRAIQSDGIYTASVFLEKTSSNQFHVILPILTGGTQLTFAVHFNSLTGEYLDIGPSFSPSSGASVESVIVEGRGAFWRVAVTVKNNNTGNGNFRFAIQPNRGESLGNATAPKANTVAIWGAQLELGTFASSYIKTESSQMSRSGDTFSRALGSEISQQDYTVVFSFIPLGRWTQFSSVVQFRSAAGLVWRLEYNPSVSTTGWTLNYPGGLVRVADTNYRKRQTFSVSKFGTKLTVYSEGAELATFDNPAIASSDISSLLFGTSGANFVLRDFFFIPRSLSAADSVAVTMQEAI